MQNVVEAHEPHRPDIVPEVLAPGLLLIRYAQSEELSPARQQRVMAAIREAAKLDAVGLVFDVGPAVTAVDADVPKFWLQVSEDASLKLRVMAVVSGGLGVRLAAKGFAVANLLRSVKIEVQAFRDLAQARAGAPSRVWNALLVTEQQRAIAAAAPAPRSTALPPRRYDSAPMSSEAAVVPEVLAPGLFLVRYDVPEQLSPRLQRNVLAQVRDAARSGPVGLIFHVGPKVTRVDPEVPKFWMEATADAALAIRVMAIVSGSLGVRMAAKGFSIANVLRAVQTEVQAFEDLPSARGWASARLRAAPARRT